MNKSSMLKAVMSRIALAMVSVVLCAGFLEVALRVHAAFTAPKTLGELRVDDRPRPGEVVTLGRIIRISDNEDLIYELIPDLDVIFCGQSVHINSNGFRGPLVSLEKSADLRIVGIGDSTMFGWGVKDDELFLQQVINKSNAKKKAQRWEAVNMAVPGYNTTMEVATLETKGFQYHPDLVILDYNTNDIELPNFISSKHNIGTLKQSFLRRFISERVYLRTPQGLMSARPGANGRGFARDSQDVPAEYAHMVGANGVLRALTRLAELRQTEPFNVLVVTHTALPAFVVDACRDFGFPTIEFWPLWKSYCVMNNIADPVRTWRLSDTDPHPNERAHEFMSGILVDAIESRGLLARTPSPSGSDRKAENQSASKIFRILRTN